MDGLMVLCHCNHIYRTFICGRGKKCMMERIRQMKCHSQYTVQTDCNCYLERASILSFALFTNNCSNKFSDLSLAMCCFLYTLENEHQQQRKGIENGDSAPKNVQVCISAKVIHSTVDRRLIRSSWMRSSSFTWHPLDGFFISRLLCAVCCVCVRISIFLLAPNISAKSVPPFHFNISFSSFFT